MNIDNDSVGGNGNDDAVPDSEGDSIDFVYNTACQSVAFMHKTAEEQDRKSGTYITAIAAIVAGIAFAVPKELAGIWMLVFGFPLLALAIGVVVALGLCFAVLYVREFPGPTDVEVLVDYDLDKPEKETKRALVAELKADFAEAQRIIKKKGQFLKWAGKFALPFLALVLIFTVGARGFYTLYQPASNDENRSATVAKKDSTSGQSKDSSNTSKKSDTGSKGKPSRSSEFSRGDSGRVYEQKKNSSVGKESNQERPSSRTKITKKK